MFKFWPGEFTHQATGLAVAVKRFKAPPVGEDGAYMVRDVMQELSTTLHLNSEKRTPLLLDAFYINKVPVLVFQLWGHSLTHLMRKGTVTSCGLQDIVRQSLEGLQILSQHSIVHFDIKPCNLLMKFTNPAPSQEFELKLADFGIAMSTQHAEETRPNTRYLQCWPYKCPELILGSYDMGCPSDMWSMGCVMYFIASDGTPLFDPNGCYHGLDCKNQINEILRIRPEGMDVFQTLPRWHSYIGSLLNPTRKNIDLPPPVRTSLMKDGKHLLESMLLPRPQDRIVPAKALAHDFFCRKQQDDATITSGSQPRENSEAAHMTLFADGSKNTTFQGERAPWKMLMGDLQPEVLEYLQEDEFLKADTETLQRYEWDSFDEPTQPENKKLSCRQLGCKIIISGGLGSPCSQHLHALRIDKPFPLQRTAKWVLAWKQKNGKAIQTLGRMVVERMQSLSCTQRNQNGNHAMVTPVDEWCLTGGNLFLTQAGGNLLEDAHVDGGAGVLHMGMTLFGNRSLRAWNSSQKPPRMSGSQPRVPEVVGKVLDLPQVPGTVFLSNSASFRHQVQHGPSENLTTFGALTDMSVSIMVRSCLFPHARSRCAAGVPSPRPVFQGIAEVIAQWMSQETLVFPDLSEVMQATPEMKLPSSIPVAPPEGECSTGGSAKSAGKKSRKRKHSTHTPRHPLKRKPQCKDGARKSFSRSK